MIGERHLCASEKLPDHSLLTWDLKISKPALNNSKVKIERKLKKCNINNIPEIFMDQSTDLIKDKIQQLENLLLENDKLDKAYDSFVPLISDEMNTQLESKYVNVFSHHYHHKSKYKPYWNDHLQYLWSDVKSREKLWLGSKGSKSGQKKYEYCQARKSFDRALRREKREYQRSEQLQLLALSERDQYQFWQKFGKIAIHNDRKVAIPEEVMDGDGTVHSNPDIVLQEWKTAFQTLYNGANEDITNNPNVNVLGNTETGNNDELNVQITKEEVRAAIQRAKIRKAAGIDNIKAEVLKNQTCVDILFHICNECFRTGQVPSAWNKSVISPIPKDHSKDPRVPLN
jgi:hypothetical protein